MQGSARMPATPDELKRSLAAIFPSLPRDFGAWGESVLENAGPTCHSVLREFSLFLARNIDQSTDRQLRRFAQFVARGLAAGGELADAMQECLLAEAGQDGAWTRFHQFLAEARD
jgi:hypothetical protein